MLGRLFITHDFKILQITRSYSITDKTSPRFTVEYTNGWKIIQQHGVEEVTHVGLQQVARFDTATNKYYKHKEQAKVNIFTVAELQEWEDNNWLKSRSQDIIIND